MAERKSVEEIEKGDGYYIPQQPETGGAAIGYGVGACQSQQGGACKFVGKLKKPYARNQKYKRDDKNPYCQTVGANHFPDLFYSECDYKRSDNRDGADHGRDHREAVAVVLIVF